MSGPITPWTTTVNPVKDGEEVKGSITNRFPEQLAQRTQHLKDRLDALNAGQALSVYNVIVDPAVSVGHAVYWNVTNSRYERAVAAVTFDNTIGGYVTSESSYVVGVCSFKHNSTTADIVLTGFISGIDWTVAAGVAGNTPASSGAYYLSPSVPGTFTKQKPPVGVYVLYLRGDSSGSAHVNPTPRELLEQHIHYAIDLVAEPAGLVDCPEPDMPYTFFAPDSSLPGWLPANDPIFSGLAPEGAVFGYNLSADPNLNQVWPPMPAATAYLEMDGVGVHPGRYVANVHGLWWFANCYGKAPWPIDVSPCGPQSSSLSSASLSSSSSGVGCDAGPTLEQMGFVYVDPTTRRMRIYFTKFVFQTNVRAVTSLAPDTGSPITVKDCDGNPASTGDLKLGLDFENNIDEGETSYRALKDIVGYRFKRGFVVTGIDAGPGISISFPDAQLGADVGGFARGQMLISSTLDQSVEGNVELVALNGVREESVADVFYLGMPHTVATSLRMRIVLPITGVPANAYLRMRFWMLAAIGGTLPQLPMSYRVLNRPGACVKIALPTSDTALTALNPGACGVMLANQYLEVTSDPGIAVVNGDEVLVTLSRVPGTPSDAYLGTVGLLRMSYSLSTTP